MRQLLPCALSAARRKRRIACRRLCASAPLFRMQRRRMSPGRPLLRREHALSGEAPSAMPQDIRSVLRLPSAEARRRRTAVPVDPSFPAHRLSVSAAIPARCRSQIDHQRILPQQSEPFFRQHLCGHGIHDQPEFRQKRIERLKCSSAAPVAFAPRKAAWGNRAAFSHAIFSGRQDRSHSPPS